MSHTQGPWSATNNSFTHENGEVADFYSITGPNCSHVCYMTEVDEREGGLADDACLVAAAPDLLEALEELVPLNLGMIPANMPDDTVLPVDVTFGEIRRARAAIAKAKGE